MTQKRLSFLVETIHEEVTRKVSLRVTVRDFDEEKTQSISPQLITELLNQRGFGQYFILEESIEGIVEDLAKLLQSLENGDSLNEGPYGTPDVAEARNATVEVKVSDDYMEAEIVFTPPRGGKPIDFDSISLVLADAGVKHGIDNQLVLNLVQEARSSQTGKITKGIVARAQPPVRGEDTRFIALVESANERILKPQLRPDGSIDVRELGNLPMVSANQKIMRKEPFTLGKPGIDVTGNPISPFPGEDFAFEISLGSIVNPENPNELLAEFNGLPNLTHHGMTVENVIKVKAVDLSTGNLDIDTGLLVEGDITGNMKVRCKGNITVGGVIESADVEAKGNILVGKGIVGQVPKDIGNAHELTTSVKAGGSINAVFASYSKLYAGTEIHLDEQLLHCDSTSKGVVTVGNNKTVGSQIIGGITRANLTIESDSIGAQAGILTRFDLSESIQQKKRELTTLEREIKEKQKQLAQLLKSYGQSASVNPIPENLQQMNKLKNTISHFTQNISQLEADSQKLREENNRALQQKAVLVKRRIYPLVEVQIANQKFRSSRMMESGSISFQDDEVRYSAKNFDKKK